MSLKKLIGFMALSWLVIQPMAASSQLKYSLDKETLPLKNGYTKNGQVKDLLKYTITLTKIK